MTTTATVSAAAARIARLEQQNQRLTALAEALVAKLVDHGVLSDEDREQLPAR